MDPHPWILIAERRCRRAAWPQVRDARRPRMPDWRRLRVGDRVRIVAIPVGDAEQYRRTADGFTVRVLRRLIRTLSAHTIVRVDELGDPFFEYRVGMRG